MPLTWGFLLCWLKNIYSSISRYRLHHGATFLRNINEVYSASAILFIFSYRAERDTEYQRNRKPLAVISNGKSNIMRIPTIQGIIDRRVLVNFTVDPNVIQKIIPQPFRPKIYKGKAIVG